MSSVIEVPTKFGALVAEPSSDPDFPEIVVSLRDGEGHDIQVAFVGQIDSCELADKVEDVLRTSNWATLAEAASPLFDITKEDLDKPDVFWC